MESWEFRFSFYKAKCDKNLAVPGLFNSLLGVWMSDETCFLVFDILHPTLLVIDRKFIPAARPSHCKDLGKDCLHRD